MALFLRTHADNAKVRNSIESLQNGKAYDFFILAHEEPGRVLDFGEAVKITHSLQTFRDYGFEVHSAYFLMHCADLLFHFLEETLPGYDHYVMVEHDVLVQRAEDRFFDRFARKLTETPAPPDLVAPGLNRPGPDWMWTAATQKVYPDVLGCFFPVVALSQRAISHLWEERLREQVGIRAVGAPLTATGDAENWMFCEPFVPSALNAAGGFVLSSLDEFMPGATSPDSFNVGPPRLLQLQLQQFEFAELVHPVVDEREFLNKSLYFREVTRTLEEFIEQLESGALPIGEELRREYAEAAREKLSAQGPPPPPETSKAAPPAEQGTLTVPQESLARVLKYVTPYAQDDPLLPAVGLVSEFVRVGGPNLEAWRFWMADVRDKDEEGRYARVLADPFPLPDVVNREGYMPGDNLAFWMSGLADYLKTVETVAAYGCAGGRMYEFGGGTGRVFRHFAAQSRDWEVWSSDFRLSSVRWNLLNYPPAIKAFANSSTPTLPLPDGFFDLVTAFSVFTHIDETETQWLLELRRTLRVGGIAYISVHDEEAWRNDAALREGAIENLGLEPDAPMPSGKTASIWRHDDPYHCNVFHDRDYLHSVWGRYFEILEIKPRWAGQQAVVVCRRSD